MLVPYTEDAFSLSPLRDVSKGSNADRVVDSKRCAGQADAVGCNAQSSLPACRPTIAKARRPELCFGHAGSSRAKAFSTPQDKAGRIAFGTGTGFFEALRLPDGSTMRCSSTADRAG